MRTQIFLTGLASLMLAGFAHAAGVSIRPGQWKMTSTMTMTMMPQPQTNTVNECIKENEINPESFNMDQENPCKITDVMVEGNTARWSISCPTESGQVMEGHWEFTSNGDSISGSGTMSMDFSGHEMGFDMTWEGKRVGDCE